MYKLLFSPQAKKDSKKIAQSSLKQKVNELLDTISVLKLEAGTFPHF